LERVAGRYVLLPIAAFTHLFSKLVLAAPASFFFAEAFSQLAAAFFSHFVMKLLSAAPASFLLVAWSWQLTAAKAADEQSIKAAVMAMSDFIPVLPF
jgi:hypothetical protein